MATSSGPAAAPSPARVGVALAVLAMVLSATRLARRRSMPVAGPAGGMPPADSMAQG